MSEAGIIRFLGSARLAIWLVALVILFAIAGALIPQEGLFNVLQIEEWRQLHPGTARIADLSGLFHVFRSYPFLLTIFFLWINIFICTVLHIKNREDVGRFPSPGSMRIGGFALLHTSLLLLLAGGVLSAAATMDGYIILTEGQVFKETPPHYLHLQKGPLFLEKHKNFQAQLKKVTDRFSPDGYLLQSEAVLRFKGDFNEPAPATVRINEPFTYSNVAFTLDQTGYSPRISIRESQDAQMILHSFVALKTFKQGLNQREYRDYIRSPLLQKRVVLTLEDPIRRILRVEVEREGGRMATATIQEGSAVDIEGYVIGFTDLRQWASFRVMEDPGYPIILIALWLGIAGLAMRYAPEVIGWFASPGNDKKKEGGDGYV